MQRLHYTGDSVWVTDEVCQALLAYARALADTQTSDVVSIPVRDVSGEIEMATFLLGPASQLYAVPIPGVAEFEVDPGVVRELRRRAELLGAPRGDAQLEPDLTFNADLDWPLPAERRE